MSHLTDYVPSGCPVEMHCKEVDSVAQPDLTSAWQFGFTNTSAVCYQGPSFLESLTGGYNYPICSNPNEYVFWDPAQWDGGTPSHKAHPLSVGSRLHEEPARAQQKPGLRH